tara:strand:- start:1936 stop:2511 length:576 start_codon:yes stop_codon:yes gene_type:complete
VRIFLLLYIFNGFLFSDQKPFEIFQLYMSQEQGRLFSINFDYQNFGENFTTSGDLWYFNPKDYVFDSQSERISNKNNNITTINKLTKQVIYDKNFKNNFDIFDFLSNTGSGIKVFSSLIEEELIKINFFLIEWDAEGTIWIMQNTGEPKRISINISNNETVDLEIISSKVISTSSLSYIDISEYEIIDLRD